jgi:hypothetical protein
VRTVRLSVATVALIGGILGLSGLAHAATASTVSVHDPGFETPAVPVGSYGNFDTGVKIGPWKVEGASGDVSVVSTSFTDDGLTFDAKQGAQYLDLTGFASNSATGVSQTVPTVVGTTYGLGFSVGNVYNPTGPFGTTSTVVVSVNGAKVLTAKNTKGKGQAKQVWEHFTVQFKAGTSTSTLRFINGDSASDNDNGLDAITLKAVSQ